MRRETIGDFFYRLPEFTERLNEFSCDGNQGIKAKLDELLADDCTLVYEIHRRRRANNKAQARTRHGMRYRQDESWPTC